MQITINLNNGVEVDRKPASHLSIEEAIKQAMIDFPNWTSMVVNLARVNPEDNS